MRADMISEMSATEIEIQKVQALDHIRARYNLPHDVAERIVQSAGTIDRACAIAELMR